MIANFISSLRNLRSRDLKGDRGKEYEDVIQDPVLFRRLRFQDIFRYERYAPQAFRDVALHRGQRRLADRVRPLSGLQLRSLSCWKISRDTGQWTSAICATSQT